MKIFKFFLMVFFVHGYRQDQIRIASPINKCFADWSKEFY